MNNGGEVNGEDGGVELNEWMAYLVVGEGHHPK